MIPHLTTALTGPLQELECRILDSSTVIEHWFRGQWQNHTPQFIPLAVQAAMTAIEKICPDAKNLLLVPEGHTRNSFYLQNVARLATILRQAGLNVRIGTLNPAIAAPTTVEVPDSPPIVLEPLVRRGRRPGLAGLDPCTILLNNDLSAGIPEMLRDLEDQVLLPPVHAGWAVRRKSNHFAAYEEAARQFAALLEIDPWLINPYFGVCGEVDFHARDGEECLAANVRALLAQIRTKYLEYGISEAPYVIVKADADTYGMGIMTARDASELRDLNRKQRNKMAVVKEGLEVSEAIVQEGVHTCERVNAAAAEPVVYMIDRHVIGGFYRVHTGRGADDVLNAPGMHFVPLAFDDCRITPDHHVRAGAGPNRFYSYGVVARLALLAASLELERTDPAQ